MSKPGTIISTTVDQFNGGIVADSRDKRENVAAMTRHFDIHTMKGRLIPHRSVEDGNDNQTTQGIRKMLYYNSKVFGLGVTPVPNKIYSRSDLSGNTWTAMNNGVTSTGAFNSDVFVEYQGYGYGWKTGGNIWKVDLADSASFTDVERSITGLGVQGLVHPKDDILYMPYNNGGQGFIASNNAGSWTNVAISLPKNMLVSSVAVYGNYLAIAVKPQYSGNSVVYLWDRDSSLTTLSESIDFGSGDLEVIEEIDGYLVGISLVGGNSTALKPRVVFRRYAGAGSAVVFNEIQGNATFSQKQKVSSRLYFMLEGTFDGVVQRGIWSVARSSPTDEFGVSFSHYPVNAGGTEVSSLQNFLLVGDYMFIAYTDAGGTDTLSKTSDLTNAYGVTSIYESTKYSNNEPSLKKQLKGVSVSHEVLAEGGQVVLKYRKDEETSWTTIFTNTTDDSISYSAVNIESTGAALPEFKEIQFRIESTGGAEITSFSFDSVITGKRPY